MNRLRKLLMPLILTLVLISGCTRIPVPKINEYIWEMNIVQGNDGCIAAAKPGEWSVLNPKSEAELYLRVNGTKIILEDKTNNKTYEGTWYDNGKRVRERYYAVNIDGIEGVCVTAMTRYYSEDSRPTLIISLGEYALTFYSKESQ